MDRMNVADMRRIAGGDPDGKICRLLDFAANPRDIADPWYTGDFDATRTDVCAGCDALLKRLKELSGRIVLSSDSHSAFTLLHGFRVAAELAKASGFAEADIFSEHGFCAAKL